MEPLGPCFDIWVVRIKRVFAFIALAAASFLDGLVLVLSLGLAFHTSAYCAVRWATFDALFAAGYPLGRKGK